MHLHVASPQKKVESGINSMIYNDWDVLDDQMIAINSRFLGSYPVI